MRRLAAIAAVLVAAIVVIVVIAVASGGGDGTYRVRAIFDSAFSVIPGEDVKVAGVKVGTIESLAVTPDKKAAVVLRIDKAGFGDFRKDASCIIRPQSLIGEKFVECTPTQPRPAGQKAPPPLQRITHGEGKGEYLLPVTNTLHNVDLDLINNIMQLPERQRLRIILAELGTGLAGNGKELNAVLRRADPALAATDRVLAVLRQQNQVLADLARDSDTVLAPLAERRSQVADFVVKARNVAQATAERRGALEQSLRRLPRFLAELRPTLRRLGGLSDQMSPVLEDLGAQAPNINRFVRQIGPLAQAARPAVSTLGAAAKVGTKAMRDIRPITQDVNQLASSSAPLASNLDALLASFEKTGGIERAMDYLFFQMAAINGFDSTGHYLRAGLLINACSTYAIEKTVGCEATFAKAGAASAASADDSGRSLYLRREDALLRGMPLSEVLRRFPEPTGGQGGGAQADGTRPATVREVSSKATGAAPLRMPDAVLPSSAAPASGPTAPAQDGSSSSSADSSPTGRLLDYLLGGGA